MEMMPTIFIGNDQITAGENHRNLISPPLAYGSNEETMQILDAIDGTFTCIP